jgi:hypothetical protein
MNHAAANWTASSTSLPNAHVLQRCWDVGVPYSDLVWSSMAQLRKAKESSARFLRDVEFSPNSGLSFRLRPHFVARHEIVLFFNAGASFAPCVRADGVFVG